MKRNDFLRSLQTIKKHLAKTSKEDQNIEHSVKIKTRKTFCICKDAQGNPKNLYISQKEAQKELQHLLETQYISLEVYPCPSESGWHLTKG